MNSLLRSTAFTRLWLAIFVSTTGNFLLMLSLSVYVYRQTGDNFAAAGVFATQWLATVASAPLSGWLGGRFDTSRLAAACELTGGVVSVLVGLFVHALPAVYLLLLVRGLAESIGKSARVLAMRDHVEDDHIERAASMIGTATFIGISVGSLVGAVLIHHLALLHIALLDAASFLLSAGLYLSLGRAPARTTAAARPAFNAVLRDGWRAVRADPLLGRQVAYMIVSTAFFQGFHNIARTLLPITRLDMGERGVMLLQALASVSFFLGAVIVTLLMQKRQIAGRVEPWGISAAAAALMLLSILASQPAWSLLAYAVFLMLSEVTYVFCQKNIVTHCPREQLGLVSPLALSAATLGLVVVIYAGGWLSDQVGLVTTAVVVALATAGCLVAIELRSPRPFRLFAPLP
ncbi:MFS transporter [Roseateles sp. SL47]|uniref:MFS transporter n=1 Tax=Roseateles sp. SL47 TaxID=2995138 RepID=UPI002271B821|nr:MFS transporter [Roseateles sp. SL47]WAC73076.1 MFS transporter [Roseateles sp. SL47]